MTRIQSVLVRLDREVRRAARITRSVLRTAYRVAMGKEAVHIRDNETGLTRFVIDARRTK